MTIRTPVLFLVFNRPDTTARVFEAIRLAQPDRLYVASDGPRSDRAEEGQRVAGVREIISAVDWNCEVKRLFREDHLGCKKAVSGAMDWFFENEEEGIILEDDCVPDQSFFPFCQDLLDRYRDDARVMAISGQSFQHDPFRTHYSYYFSRYPHCWGWATWKRAWNHWDGDLSIWPEVRDKGFLNDIGGNDHAFSTFWSDVFDRCHAGTIDSWAYPWNFSCWVQGGLTVLPYINLVSNIGFGSGATHTKDPNDKNANLPSQTIRRPLQHPPFVIRDAVADSFTDKNIIGIGAPQSSSIFRRLIRKVRRIVGNPNR